MYPTDLLQHILIHHQPILLVLLTFLLAHTYYSFFTLVQWPLMLVLQPILLVMLRLFASLNPLLLVVQPPLLFT